MIEGRQTFAKKWLSPEPGENNIDLAQWIARRRHLRRPPPADQHRRRRIPQPAFGIRRDPLPLSHHRDRGPRALGDPGRHHPPQRAGALLGKLSELFVPVHAHPNNCCGEFVIPGTEIRIPNVLKLTYLRRDRASKVKYPPLLPHPNDVGRNVSAEPPMFFGEAWLDGPGRSNQR
ncbi:hypothetical protein ABID21_001007 [Pseudorhizobium tarimense]|uniref:Uncharacterized protein n=1 Tax=Pseudorhizobium tarimense TaxID=1079109 RepID=A0ABV2H2X7_9HYPH|nr:hypothetical protein [Pseudorhizobium tarimense]MCJ8518101.1 hypothetical protein [Pseudorhizobium tarimense]